MLSAEGLIAEARRSAALENFGDMEFVEGLTVLVHSLNTEVGLTPSNETAFKRELLRVLVNRLRMQRDIELNPAILTEEILPPIFISSLPRTGSTKLHRLMAATGDFQALKFWHTFDFARIPGGGSNESKTRIESAHQYLQWLEQRAPAYQQYHPMYAEEAEEELILLDAGFISLCRYIAFFDLPSFVTWVFGRDPRQAFRFLHRMLQYQQWQHFRGQRKRWVLKTPMMFGVEAPFAAVFPGMDFIVTHRHPVTTLPSTCALQCGVRAQYNDHVPTANAADIILFAFGERLKSHLQWRDEYPAHKVHDVPFDVIASNELGALEGIYRFLGLELTDAARSRVREWIAMDAKRDHHRSTATMADYGLTAEAIEARLGAYIQRYRNFL